MEVVYLLLALAVFIAGVMLWAFFWSMKNGQFDDLEGPAHGTGGTVEQKRN